MIGNVADPTVQAMWCSRFRWSRARRRASFGDRLDVNRCTWVIILARSWCSALPEEEKTVMLREPGGSRVASTREPAK